MSAKKLAMESLKDLPKDVSWQEIKERIHFLAAPEKARDEVRSGQVVSQEKVRNALEGWLSK